MYFNIISKASEQAAIAKSKEHRAESKAKKPAGWQTGKIIYIHPL